MSKELLADIEAFLKRTKMGHTYFGVVAAGNSELVGRLRKGKTVHLTTAEKVRAYLDTHAAPPPAKGHAKAVAHQPEP